MPNLAGATPRVNPRWPDLAGQRFGRLVVVGLTGRDRFKRRLWLCRCDCGNFTSVPTNALRNGNTKSCGCVRVERCGQLHRTHGMRHTPEYGVWARMRDRCGYRYHQDFRHYQGRGIVVCQRWLHSFQSFFRDMGPRPSPRHSLDRIDNDQGYNCGRCGDCRRRGVGPNCRWATQKDQCRNKRSNHRLTIRGECLPISQWAERAGVNERMIGARLRRGWPPEQAVWTPPLRRWNTRRRNYPGAEATGSDPRLL